MQSTDKFINFSILFEQYDKFRDALIKEGNLTTQSTENNTKQSESEKVLFSEIPNTKPAPSFNFAKAGFAPSKKSGWSCQSCFVQNKDDDIKCISCEVPNPQNKAVVTKLPAPYPTESAKPASPFNFSSKPPAPTSGFVSPESAKPAPSFNFASAGYVPTKKSGWSCQSCFVQNKDIDIKCISCEVPNPQNKAAAMKLTPQELAKPASPFNFSSKPPAPTSGFVPPASSAEPAPSFNFAKAGFAPTKKLGWSCQSCFVQNKEVDIKCISCEVPNPQNKAVVPKLSASYTGFVPPESAKPASPFNVSSKPPAPTSGFVPPASSAEPAPSFNFASPSPFGTSASTTKSPAVAESTVASFSNASVNPSYSFGAAHNPLSSNIFPKNISSVGFPTSQQPVLSSSAETPSPFVVGYPKAVVISDIDTLNTSPKPPPSFTFGLPKAVENSSSADKPTYSFGLPPQTNANQFQPPPFSFSGASSTFGMPTNGTTIPKSSFGFGNSMSIETIKPAADGDDDDTLPLEEQVNLMQGAGEESEKSLFQQRANLFVQKGGNYEKAGTGEIKLNLNEKTLKYRILFRSEGGGRVLLNDYMTPTTPFFKADNTRVNIVLQNSSGKLETWLIRVKSSEDMDKFLGFLEDIKKKRT
jgi:Zn-finger protein